MFCSNCGKDIVESMKFCSNCGNQINYDNNDNSDTNVKTKCKRKFFCAENIIITVCCLFLLIIAIIAINENSLSNRLMGNTWWAEIEYHNDYLEYSDTYLVTADCYCYTFCPSGNIRIEDFDFGLACYELPFEVTADNMPSFFTFPEVNSSREDTWELLSNKELLISGYFYKWSEKESGDTWYLTGDTLRIGDRYFVSKNPGVKVSPESQSVPSYWCSNCGEEGSSNSICPECGSKDKIKCELVAEE